MYRNNIDKNLTGSRFEPSQAARTPHEKEEIDMQWIPALALAAVLGLAFAGLIEASETSAAGAAVEWAR